ncbi:MAG: 23S rRNA (pseudouridine(1915)-N(3))-methyltransferase RlmH [Pseudomonadota bacterium]
MRIRICAVGRLRGGPEADMVNDYLTRFDRTGRALGLGPAEIVEVEAKKGGKSGEASLLQRVLPANALTCVLDERGKLEASPAFANRMMTWRDDGTSDLAFLIGGADGLDASLRNDAHHALSFGPMVWPHMMVRIMLAEQLYRAASILSGSPYHRA